MAEMPGKSSSSSEEANTEIKVSALDGEAPQSTGKTLPCLPVSGSCSVRQSLRP